MSDIPDPAAYEAGMPENFPGQPPAAESRGLVIDPEADALATELDAAADPVAAIEAGAGGGTTVDQAAVNNSQNLETPLSDAEIYNAAANGDKDLDLENASDDEIYNAAVKDLRDRSASPDDLQRRNYGPDDSTGDAAIDSVYSTVVDDEGGQTNGDDEPEHSTSLESETDTRDIPDFLKKKTSTPGSAGIETAASSINSNLDAADADLEDGSAELTPQQVELARLSEIKSKNLAAFTANQSDIGALTRLGNVVRLEALLQADRDLPADADRPQKIEDARALVEADEAANPSNIEPVDSSIDSTPQAVETPLSPQTGAARLAELRSLAMWTGAQRREARELGAKQRSFAELHQLGDQRDVEQDAEYKELYADFGSTVEGNGPGRTEAVPVEKSASQTRIEELREREESEGELNQQESEELSTLEDSQKRYNELMDKDELNSEERTELTKLAGEWGDPELRAAENEVLGQAEKSLSSPESFANFAKALEMYAVKKSGENLHKAVKDGLATAITEYFARKSSELNPGELRALKQVQELLKGMQQEIVVIMTYKKQLEAQVEAQRKLVKRVEAQQKIVKKNGDIDGNDQKRQRDALMLTAYYNKLAVVNANIILTSQKAQDANFNFNWKHRRVKKALGVGGGYFNDVAIFGDQIRRLKRWADRQAGSVGTSLPLAEPIRSS